ncbi:MAG: 16S rRNA (uracil(1498)-N(3))-methyltransferase [Bacteroidales bacterium]|nr:16S rRNA (uracil(1498)-N(3))-methyltransferase [Bacteroidales bacterium]
MDLFYSRTISEGDLFLNEEESGHCVKVMRYRAGDTIFVIDGTGNLYECVIVDAHPKKVEFTISSQIEGYGAHPYRLNMAVAPPKNIDRFEWFCEKATEIGVDEITPLFGEYSERKVFKKERCERLIVAAAKQSHKGAIPKIYEAVSVKDFLSRQFPEEVLKIICYCGDVAEYGMTKLPLTTLLNESQKNDVVIMIGPEGDFSRAEIALAIENGWRPASIGDSRLRIETAALTAVAALYLKSSS